MQRMIMLLVLTVFLVNEKYEEKMKEEEDK